MNPEQTALIVLRVSTHQQLKGFSIDTQRKYCVDYANEHKLIVPPDGMYIRDETGATLEQADIQHALNRLRRGEAKHLIIFALDRLTRAPEDFIPLRREFQQAGITMHVALEGRTLSADPLEQLSDDMKIIFAKMERATFRKRSIEGRSTKIANGYIPGNGPAPYGFEYVGSKRERKLIINEDEAKIVRMMAQLFIYGEGDEPPFSVARITRHLTNLSIPTRADSQGRSKTLHGYGEWDIATVSAILRDTTLGGVFHANRYERLNKKQVRLRPREEWIPISVPPILDINLFDAVQRKLDQGRALASRNNSRHFYLLRCRVRCSCGYAVNGIPSQTSAGYYRCLGQNRTRYPNSKCQLPYIPIDLLNTRVWDWLLHEALDEIQLQAHIDRERARVIDSQGSESIIAQYAEIEAKLAANKADEQRLLAEYIRGRFTETAIDIEISRIAVQRQQLEKNLIALRNSEEVIPLLSDEIAYDLRTYIAIIREGLTDMSPSEQRRVIDMLDTQLFLSVENDAVVADATCILRLDNVRLLIDKRTRTG